MLDCFQVQFNYMLTEVTLTIYSTHRAILYNSEVLSQGFDLGCFYNSLKDGSVKSEIMNVIFNSCHNNIFNII